MLRLEVTHQRVRRDARAMTCRTYPKTMRMQKAKSLFSSTAFSQHAGIFACQYREHGAA